MVEGLLEGLRALQEDGDDYGRACSVQVLHGGGVLVARSTLKVRKFLGSLARGSSSLLRQVARLHLGGQYCWRCRCSVGCASDQVCGGAQRVSHYHHSRRPQPDWRSRRDARRFLWRSGRLGAASPVRVLRPGQEAPVTCATLNTSSTTFPAGSAVLAGRAAPAALRSPRPHPPHNCCGKCNLW